MFKLFKKKAPVKKGPVPKKDLMEFTKKTAIENDKRDSISDNIRHLFKV